MSLVFDLQSADGELLRFAYTFIDSLKCPVG